MRLLATLAAVLLTTVGCSDLGESPERPKRDEYDLANACQEVAVGSVPEALVTGDEMFNASQLQLTGNKLRFMLSQHRSWDGGVASYDLDRGTVGRTASGDISQLGVGARTVYWFDHATSSLHRTLDDGQHETYWLSAIALRKLAGDPATNNAWYVRDGSLFWLSKGESFEVASGGFGDTLAVTRAGVWAFTNTGSGEGSHGQLLFSPRNDVFQPLLDYSATTPVDLRADETAAVYMLRSSIGTIASDGSQARVLYETTGWLEQLAIDDTYAYFTERSAFGATLQRVARDGSSPAETLTEMRCHPMSLAVARGRVFFTTYAWDYDRPAPGALWAIPAAP